MKILHTADWHLGKHLNNVSRHAEQQEVLNEICSIANAHEVDAVVIAGDLFDTFNPPSESIELFYKTLKKLANNGKRAVIAIAGNHDSPDRIEAPDPLARACGIVFAGYPNSVVAPFELETGLKVTHSAEGFMEVQLPHVAYPLRLMLTPYANEYRLKTYLGHEKSTDELRNLLQHNWQQIANTYCNNNGVNMLVTHLLMMQKGDSLPDEPDDEKPILHIGGAQAIYTDNIPVQIQYTALGHLHRKQCIGAGAAPVIYCGSPLSYSFGEANQKKYVVVADMYPGAAAVVTDVALHSGKPLLRKRAENVDEAIEWLQQHPNAWIELTMATETYLTADERKRLYAANGGIVSLIPDVTTSSLVHSSKQHIDVSNDMTTLFTAYFKHEKGQEPNDAIIDLFKEVLSEQETV